ncbi:hypothetical protein [Jeotgalibacillus haloalkalitolerans]|uniref:Uncharacterized protein n=1 Tax=Jeotgalibacillus haloalkalitolerans TaxID=3104292 RepID=A0ABU5KMV3_9BACL|nr:hypothetical protein [Jeotgalibacillus sp. HH7-29]MDZ5712584.1 hypothetical protein [Jeotgalibacillus sp. HH7-29]
MKKKRMMNTDNEQLITLYKKISQLKRDLSNETDKLKKRKITKEIKKIQGGIPHLKRQIYEREKRANNSAKKGHSQQDILIKQEEKLRELRAKEYLETRKNIISKGLRPKETDKSDKSCSSCGAPYNFNSGFSRCRCS